MIDFKFPDIHEIHVLAKGQRFEGRWWLIGGEMHVGYNGYCATTYQHEPDSHSVACELLSNLVGQHYVELDSLPTGLPLQLRDAAHSYVNASMDEDESAAAELIASFGDSTIASDGYRQIAWLCVNALSMIVPAWKHMCDGNDAEETLASLKEWLLNSEHVVDWNLVTTPLVPLRNGEFIGDCDACRLDPISDALAHTSRYLQIADTNDAMNALVSASSAFSEGCHTPNAPDRFEKWLVLHVLESALECKPIAPVA